MTQLADRPAGPTDPGPRPTGGHTWLRGLVAVGVVCLLLGGLMVLSPSRFGPLAVLLGVGAGAVALGMRNPTVAAVYLLAASFLRLALPPRIGPLDLFVLAFLGLVTSACVWLARQEPSRDPRQRRTGLLELVVVLYVAWNIGSAIAPHPYPATYPLDGSDIPVVRFVLIGVVMPLVVLVLGRTVFGRRDPMRAFLLTTLVLAAYSALMSIVSRTVPALAWPRYMVDDTPWPERAVGVFNQPVVNGMMLTIGFVVCLLVAAQPTEPRWLRRGAGLLAPACLVALYLTYTRSAYLGLVVVLLLGAWLARGWRTGFVATLAAGAVGVVVNWSTLSSSDREAGGVSSPGEIFDRLNMIATGLRAISEKPIAGWGIGRFPAVNTYHHEQWSPEVPWSFGYGLSSHTDVVGVGVELGLVGVVLYLLVYAVVVARLVRAVRTLEPRSFDYGFAVLGLLSVVCLIVTGLTVDLRFFDFPNLLVLLLAGAAIGRAENVSRRPTGSADRTSGPTPVDQA